MIDEIDRFVSLVINIVVVEGESFECRIPHRIAFNLARKVTWIAGTAIDMRISLVNMVGIIGGAHAALDAGAVAEHRV